MTLVILTGDQLRHRHLVNELARRYDVRGVVVEPVFMPTTPAGDDGVVIARHLAERDEVEADMFANDHTWLIASADRLAVGKGHVNAPDTIDWIRARSPAWLVVFGSSVLKDGLLAAFEGRCVNLHLGLSPYYRGSGTNFWPLVNREPELVGATIHVVDRGLDSGPIFTQVRPAMQPGDRAHQIGCRAIMAGARAMADVLGALEQRVVSAVTRTTEGRVYRRKDFNAAAVRTMWHHLDSGMVPEYLAAPERNARYPLVSADV